MTKLNRRSFLLSAGIGVIAAPVLVNAQPVESSRKSYEVWADFLKYYDGLPADVQQEKIDSIDPILEKMNKKFRNGEDVSKAVKEATRRMKQDLAARKKQ